jgi:hypothetical protein
MKTEGGSSFEAVFLRDQFSGRECNTDFFEICNVVLDVVTDEDNTVNLWPWVKLHPIIRASLLLST